MPFVADPPAFIFLFFGAGPPAGPLGLDFTLSMGFFNVFANPNYYPVEEKTNTVGRHLECIDHVMSSFWNIEVQLNNENAKIPTQAHESDAGWDLYACEPKKILPNERETINTGVSLAIPKAFVGLI